MRTDYHTHILPKFDDGAKNVETSLKMLENLKKQKIQRVIATPHFYAHRKTSVADFVAKRERSFLQIVEQAPLHITLGAEVALEQNLSEVPDIEKLAIEGTNLILLELPYQSYRPWMSEEIHNISTEFGLQVILAHINRYMDFYSMEQLEQILQCDAIFQINNEAFDVSKERRLVKMLIKRDYPLVFGSDCHNLKGRKPNWNLFKLKGKAALLEFSDSILDEYTTD